MKDLRRQAHGERDGPYGMLKQAVAYLTLDPWSSVVGAQTLRWLVRELFCVRGWPSGVRHRAACRIPGVPSVWTR